MSNGNQIRVPVQTGLSDGTNTEITGDTRSRGMMVVLNTTTTTTTTINRGGGPAFFGRGFGGGR